MYLVFSQSFSCNLCPCLTISGLSIFISKYIYLLFRHMNIWVWCNLQEFFFFLTNHFRCTITDALHGITKSSLLIFNFIPYSFRAGILNGLCRWMVWWSYGRRGVLSAFVLIIARSYPTYRLRRRSYACTRPHVRTVNSNIAHKLCNI